MEWTDEGLVLAVRPHGDTGAIAELQVGDPLDYATDIGPVIDEDARQTLDAHKARMATEARTLASLAVHFGIFSPAISAIDFPP